MNTGLAWPAGLVQLRTWAVEFWNAVHFLPHNPLQRYFRLELEHRARSRGWWRNFWFIAGLNCALLQTAVIGYYAWQVFAAGHGIGAQVSAQASVVAATMLICWSWGIFSVLWLAYRLYLMARFSLGLLSLKSGWTRSERIDDLVASSPLSDADILLAAAAHSLYLVFPALLLANIFLHFTDLLLALGTAGLQVNASELFNFAPHHWICIGLEFGGMLVSGSLATVLLCWLLVFLGCNEKAPLLPIIGAVSQVALQPLIFVLAWVGLDYLDYLNSINDRDWLHMFHRDFYLVGALVLLIYGLLLVLARYNRLVKKPMAWCLPLVLVFLLLAAYGPWLLADQEIGESALLAAWPLQALGLFNTGLLSGSVFWARLTYSYHEQNLVLAGLVPLAQLLLLAGTGGFALGAVRRRRLGL